MKLSVSTKIFLGFAVVIIGFGAAAAYTVYRTSSLSESITVIWRDVGPLRAKLKNMSRVLRNTQEFLQLKRPGHAELLSRRLPALTLFEELERIEQRLEELVASARLSSTDEEVLAAVSGKLRRLRVGNGIAVALAGSGVVDLGGASKSSEELLGLLLRRTVKRANEGQLKAGSPEAKATIRALRRVDRAVDEAARELVGPIRGLEERAASDEKAATLAVILVGAGALVLSLVMLVMSQLTLAPIRQLRAGARRIAAGSYGETVRVRSQDEIGQLANEFNRMAEALRARDAELERQREELLRADRLATIGTLAAQITHEVRNPLSSIGLNAELLEEEFEELGEADEARALLAAIQDEVQRLKSITEEYLRYARMPRPDLSLVDIGELLTQFLAFLAHELDHKGIECITVGVAPADEGGPAPIRADADQLRQAVLNVCRNGVEALAELDGEKLLKIELEALEPGGVTIRIADSGPGIDKALRDRIFEPFVTGKSGGTGLGLAMAEQIIREHGGSIAVGTPSWSRELGRAGTEFRIELPVVEESQQVVGEGQPGYSG